VIAFLRRHFGRITLERARAELLSEAKALAEQNTVKALHLQEASARLALDAQHHQELAAHYAAAADRLSQHQPKEFMS